MPPRPRLVRRAPLLERIKAYLNPLDFLLWLSEELNSNDWEDFQKQWAYPAGLVLNVLFMVARANSGHASDADSDIFADSYDSRGGGWLSWLAASVVWTLSLASFTNAFYTFWRRRHYRLFEASIDVTPNTPSARRVRVDSSPFSSTPLRFLQETILSSSAQARAHSDPTRDVWEVHVWDPTPLCLRIFCMFSPGHVFIYGLFLPLNPLDSRPSVTVATTIFLAFLISAQLLLLQSNFAQQARDNALIYKEVQNEYETKFVRPTIYHPVRDAGTQMISEGTPSKTHEVLVSTPKTFVNRGFKPNPNANYARHYDPDTFNTPGAVAERFTRPASTSVEHSPLRAYSGDYASPTKGNMQALPQQSQPGSAIRPGGARDSGHFGVYTHAQSPLKKSVAIQSTPQHRSPAVASGSRFTGQTSAQKRVSTPGGAGMNGTPVTGQRISHLRGDGIRRDSSRF